MQPENNQFQFITFFSNFVLNSFLSRVHAKTQEEMKIGLFALKKKTVFCFEPFYALYCLHEHSLSCVQVLEKNIYNWLF